MALGMPQMGRMVDLKGRGCSPSETKAVTGASYPTIRKHCGVEDFSPRKPGGAGRPSKTNAYEGETAAMPDSDRRCHRKQRHTAKRICGRLVEGHGCDGSHSSVQRRVREMRRGRRQAASDQYVRLSWAPGALQAGFGQAGFGCPFGGAGDGSLVRMRFLPMSLPHSSDARCGAFGDEKGVCVCQAPQDLFEMVGGVPRTVVPGNATEAGRRWRDVVTGSKPFGRFGLRYGFEARFCNPDAGHGKGNVENEVGYIRRNLMTPVPPTGDLRDCDASPNAGLEAHSREREHYEKGLTWAGPSEADGAALMPLPAARFDVVHWTTCGTDGCGRVPPDDGRHLCLASPDPADVRLTVGIRASTVGTDGLDGVPIRGHRRRTGERRTHDEGPLALMGLLARKTGAFGSSSVRAMLSDACGAHFDSMGREGLPSQTRTMARLARAHGADVTVGAFGGACGITGATRPAGVGMTAARMAAGGRRTGPAVEHGTRMVEYDSLITRGTRHG
ncbi:transposase [Olsenella sp. Marseille-P4559]|uniref:transposase n=1 Tax=Olsenella sp. Marseille-P4559 TaxID=2364795 RepID=UPI0010319BE7|nr:transposase [Olsenella sp. Marseille-P4559]